MFCGEVISSVKVLLFVVGLVTIAAPSDPVPSDINLSKVNPSVSSIFTVTDNLFTLPIVLETSKGIKISRPAREVILLEGRDIVTVGASTAFPISLIRTVSLGSLEFPPEFEII